MLSNVWVTNGNCMMNAFFWIFSPLIASYSWELNRPNNGILIGKTTHYWRVNDQIKFQFCSCFKEKQESNTKPTNDCWKRFANIDYLFSHEKALSTIRKTVLSLLPVPHDFSKALSGRQIWIIVQTHMTFHYVLIATKRL